MLVLLLLAIVLPLAVFVIRLLDTRTQTIEQIVSENGSYVLDEVDACVQRPRQYGVATPTTSRRPARR